MVLFESCNGLAKVVHSSTTVRVVLSPTRLDRLEEVLQNRGQYVETAPTRSRIRARELALMSHTITCSGRKIWRHNYSLL